MKSTSLLHLAVHFDPNFLVEKNVFQHIINHKCVNNPHHEVLANLSIPALMMTATFSLSLLEQLETMIGIFVLPSIFLVRMPLKATEWHRYKGHLFHSTIAKKFKKLPPALCDAPSKKIILYGNTSNLVINTKEQFDV